MSGRYHDSIFWIEVDKIKPNPLQPRREFDETKLQTLADSIRQYGVLQPIVVTRQEVEREDGGLSTEYELIAGERRWRASQLAGLSQIPSLIRSGEESDKLKLEMAIIENLQREDLNPVDRARAFSRLADEFNFQHTEIAKRIGKSREYVSNTIRILALPEEILQAITGGRISEGHSRPLLMLSDRPEEQQTVFDEILLKKLTVRQVEAIARRIAYDRVRKKERFIPPEIIELEQQISENFGTRVQVEQINQDGPGKVTIDFFSNDDLREILNSLTEVKAKMAAAQAGGEPLRTGFAEGSVLSGPTEAESAPEPEPEPNVDDEPDLYNIGKW